VTQTTSRMNTGSTFLNPRLRKLLEESELDWDNPRHREAYLKYWLSQPLPQEEDPSVE
jgi:hypothetical protein